MAPNVLAWRASATCSAYAGGNWRAVDLPVEPCADSRSSRGCWRLSCCSSFLGRAQLNPGFGERFCESAGLKFVRGPAVIGTRRIQSEPAFGVANCRVLRGRGCVLHRAPFPGWGRPPKPRVTIRSPNHKRTVVCLAAVWERGQSAITERRGRCPSPRTRSITGDQRIEIGPSWRV